MAENNKQPTKVEHKLSPAVAEKYELSEDMQPTRAILGHGWGKKWTGQEVDFRTMSLKTADELASLKHEETGEEFPFLIKKSSSQQTKITEQNTSKPVDKA